MNKIGLIVVALLLTIGQVFGQEINFFNGTLDEAIKQAKSEKKFIFFLIKKNPTEINKNIVEVIDRHAYDMAIYNEVEVSEFYNNNFINFLYEDAGYLTDSYGNLLSSYPDKATKNLAKQLKTYAVGNDFSSMFISYLGDIAQINDNNTKLYESKTENMILGYAEKVLKDYQLNIIKNNKISVLEKINIEKQTQDKDYNENIFKYINLPHDTIFQSKSLKNWESRIGCWNENCITSAIPTNGNIEYFVEFIFNLKAFKDEQVEIIRNATYLKDAAYGDDFIIFRDNRILIEYGTQYTCMFQPINYELPLGNPITIHGDTLKIFYSSIDNAFIVNGLKISIGQKWAKQFLTSVGIMADSDEVNNIRENGLVSLIIGKYVTKYSDENINKLKGNWFSEEHFEKMKYLVAEYPSQIDEFEKIPYDYLKKFYVEPKSKYFPDRFQKFYEIFSNSKKIAEIKELESKVKYYDDLKRNKSEEIKQKKEKMRFESGNNAVFSIDHSAGGWDYVNFADGTTGELYYRDSHYGINISSWIGLGTEFIPYMNYDNAIQASYEYAKSKSVSNIGRYYPTNDSYSSSSSSSSSNSSSSSSNIECYDANSIKNVKKGNCGLDPHEISYQIKSVKCKNGDIYEFYYIPKNDNWSNCPNAGKGGYYKNIEWQNDYFLHESDINIALENLCNCK